ncbi:MAG TPA: glycosyl transferase [Feifaniaceae bacterium]|nr:glycosyl transferase [Feifaniaceae bacterium]
MKAVLLTCSTGQGHNSAAQAVKKALERRGAECDLQDALTFLGENVSKTIEEAFVNVAVKTPRAFGFLYAAGEFLSSERRKSPVYFANALYAENLRTYLTEHEIDAAVCPHLFPAEALTYLKKKQQLSARTYYISTDYACIPFLEETEMDAVFTPHPDLTDSFVKRGIPAALLIPSGVPVDSAYCARVEKADARLTLDLPVDLPCYLVMTGGEGCGDAQTLTKKLLERLKGRDARIVVLTGHNAQLQRALESRFGGEVRVLAVPFTHQVPLYMDACDVLLTKPGGISSTEAAIKGIPMVHTPPIPGAETLNAQFFGERGMSIFALNEDSAAENAIRLALDLPQRTRMLAAQKQYLSPLSADRIAARILGQSAEPQPS